MFSRQLSQTELLHMLPLSDGYMEEFLQSVKKKVENKDKTKSEPKPKSDESRLENKKFFMAYK